VNVYPFIDAEKRQGSDGTRGGNLKRSCELLGVSRSAYYADAATQAAGGSSGVQQDAVITGKTIQFHDDSNGTDGSPRVHRPADRRHLRRPARHYLQPSHQRQRQDQAPVRTGRPMSGKRPTVRPPNYAQQLVIELDSLAVDYTAMLSNSAIVNVHPNRDGRNRGITFIGSPHWGWTPSDAAAEATRMDLLRRLSEWAPRMRLLFPHPTPTVSKRLDKSLDLLERWLLRDGRDITVPRTVSAAKERIQTVVVDLKSLLQLLPPNEYPVRLTPDTNALIDNPDLAAYTAELGLRYMAHLLPVALGEIDNLKRAGRTPDLRQNADRANRRLKGLRTNGDVRAGVRVAGDVYAIFEHVEPRSELLPTWLDTSVPDDRFVAAALLLQSQHPGSALYVATSDINMQTKLAAAGLPFVEPPSI
jgi:hypothetical protein